MEVVHVVKRHLTRSRILLLLVIAVFVLVIKFEREQEVVTKYVYYKSPLDKPEDSFKRQNLVIFADTRSGTSFLLGALQNAESTFTTYEPLWAIRNYNTPEETKLSMLLSFLNCNFSSTPGRVFLREMIKPEQIKFYRIPGRFPLSIDQMQETLKNLSSSKQLDVMQRQMNKECKKNDHTVLKVIEARLTSGLESMLSITQDTSKSVTRVVHIVRDPRAAVSSRIRRGWYPKPGDPTLITKVQFACKRALKNWRLCKQYQKSMPTRFLCIQYKDLAESPKKNLETVLSFAKLRFDPGQFKQWVINHTQSESRYTEGTGSFAFDLTRNSKENTDRWMHTTSVALTRLIEEHCQPLLDEMGLAKA